MSAGSLPEPAVEFESHGVVLVLDDALTVVQASERCEVVVGETPQGLVGRPVETALGPDIGQVLRDTLDEGVARAGGWWPVRIPAGDGFKLRAFEAGPGLIGVDLLPVVNAATRVADAGSIERVAGWNDWLLSCTSSTDLLQIAASVTRERLGFDGVWVCRSELGGHDTVVAADVSTEGGELVGYSVKAADVPPSQPRMRGRAIPFFVADLALGGNRLVPGSASAGLEGSSLLRPYPGYIGRLLSLGVRATVSLPIILGGRLWGRVLAHHPTAKRVPAATQSELRLLAAAVSARLAELMEQEDALEQVELARFSLRLMGSIAASPDLVGALTADAADLTGICAADGAIVASADRVATCGIAATRDEVDALLQIARSALSATPGGPLVASVTLDDACGVRPEIAAGYLAVRLGHDARDVVMWLRAESTRAVTWIEHEVVGDTLADALFTGVAERQELSNGACAPWTSAQLAQADELREAIGQVQLSRYRQVQALNDELTRSNEQHDAFTHAVAHDLKAPIRGIRQNVEFHVEDTAGRLSDPEQEQLETVLRLTYRMDALLDDLMAYAQAGQSTWEPRPLDLPGAVDEVLEFLGPRARTVTVTTEPASFTTDPPALRQILVNLVGNAAKYSDGLADVAIGVTTLEAAAALAPLPETLQSAPSDTEVLTVADRGIGIDPSHHDRIFNLFLQLDPRAEGTGTGLALCRLLCRGHGGEIWLKSAVGEGTTFFVCTGR